ncbi:MAG: cupin domain-containing protein [Alphaproteobacteria bacterium]|nr:cupin domain-containing protein [Alphaproteobacteria bacterium]
MKEVVNTADIALDSHRHGERFAAQTGEIGLALGLNTLGCMLHIVQPGKMSGPYHRHHGCDEMFYIIAGEGEYRIGEKRIAVKAGDCLGAPAGGEAHQLLNTGTGPLRYLGLSNNPAADLVEYPDSGKISMRVGAKGVMYDSATYTARGRLTPADYWDGEDA